ncbi:hypothetical protein [Nonomuraea sp. NPDC049607]|uniref:hypothetical protein n=1 Tax=Nonomuraea sp. NPDC049607 TaxID=3154732 RepID=UPI00343164D6
MRVSPSSWLNPDLTKLPSGPTGGLRPKPDGRLAVGIWAAGDCCETRHRLTGG